MNDRPDEINDTPVEWRENAFGVMKAYAKIELGETQVVTVPRRVKNPVTERVEDLTRLSNDGYCQKFLAALAAYHSQSVIDLRNAPVLTFDKDRWEIKELDDHVVVQKQEPESNFDERVLGSEQS